MCYGLYMRARFIHLSPKKAQEFSALKREAERDGAHRVARRLHAVLLNHQQHTSGEIARLLEAPRSKVSLWRVASASVCDGISPQAVVFAPDYGNKDSFKIRSLIHWPPGASAARLGRLAEAA